MKYFYFLIFTLLIINLSSQNTREQIYFDQGINEYNLGNYVKADSLFTWCIRIKPHKLAYHNRALCRAKVGNKEGYCTDLILAQRYGDDNRNLYWTHCGKADTSYVDQDLLPTGKSNFTYKEISYINFYNKLEQVFLYDKNNEVVAAYQMKDSLGNVYTHCKNPPELFKNSEKEYWHKSKNLKYPKEFYKRKKNYIVAAEIIILENGSIHKVILTHKNNDVCIECDAEVIRYYMSLKDIKPATFNNIPVKFNYYVSVFFDQEKPQRDY